MTLTPRLDLRGGRDCWSDDPSTLQASDPLPDRAVDVVVIGAGVTGAMIAERLTRSGAKVAVIDRRAPATGSTAASTALVLWAPDQPMVEHRERYGVDGAALRWKAVFDAVQGLDRHVRELGLTCGWAARPEVYLAGTTLDAQGLKREAEARQAAGLPSRWLSGVETASAFGVEADAALLSEGASETDPVALTRGLLAHARMSGATVTYPADAVGIDEAGGQVTVRLADGRHVMAKHLILATGYEVEHRRLAGFSLGSSYAVATARGQPAPWRRQAMIWEASDPYLYIRATPDGRIIVGGEDEDFADPVRRDALIDAKARALKQAVRTRLGPADIEFDCAWAATFGSSRDGLPAVGRRAGHEHTLVAHSFGGNGIAFAALAADILHRTLSGEPQPSDACFDPDRFEDVSEG